MRLVANKIMSDTKPLSLADALKWATPLNRLDAEVLLAHVLSKPRSTLYSSPEKVLTETEWQRYQACVKRRIHKEPIAYIVGTKEFWSLTLHVNQHTLIPRPETELLVETILDLYDETSPLTIADVGTGSGAIALALAKERRNWHILASDVSEAALDVAKKNAKNYGIKNVTFYHGHLLKPLYGQKLDVIVSNPPYLAEVEWLYRQDDLQYEPKGALVFANGEDKPIMDNGLTAIEELASTAKFYLKSGGLLLVEHGFLQGKFVRDIFKSAEFIAVSTLKDLTNLERVTYGKLKS